MTASLLTSSCKLRPAAASRVDVLRRARPAAAVRRARPAAAAASLGLPAIVPMVFRALTAGVMFYASMNWVWARGMRKDIEKAMEADEKRRNKVDKLSPPPPAAPGKGEPRDGGGAGDA